MKATKNQAIYLETAMSFLKEIGIEYYITDEDFNSFLGGVKIENGQLKINLNQLLCIGDILHEAGHLACIPSNLRLKANDNIAESLGEEFTYELGVISWSVAAAIHLNIPLTEVFHEGGYKKDSKWLLEQYMAENYIGLPLLQWMGLADFEDELVEGEVFPFPKMLRWTRM